MRYKQMLVGVSLLVASVVGTASANESHALVTRCNYERNFAGQVVEMRDRGIDSIAIITWVRTEGRQSLDWLSAAQQDEIEGRLINIVTAIYTGPALTPAQAKLAAWTACFRAAAPPTRSPGR
jgi:hypothetical protein